MRTSRRFVAILALAQTVTVAAEAASQGTSFWRDYGDMVHDLSWNNLRGDGVVVSGQAGIGLWFNKDTTFGRNKQQFGHSSDHFQEFTGLLAVDGHLGLGRGKEFGELYGEVSGTGAWTTATEPGGNNARSDLAWETYYSGWRSAGLLPALGPNAIDISGGKQNYQIGTGFLYWNGSTNGGQRAMAWTALRTAWEETAIAKLKTHGLTAQVAYLKPDDNPDTESKFVTTDIEYDFANVVDIGTAAFGYSHFFHSDLDTRDGMDVWNLRATLTPLKPTDVLPGLNLLGEWAYEDNDDKLESTAWFTEVGYDFKGVLPWAPYLGYRYASFEGGESESGKSHNWDSLFYGMGGNGNQSWGTWFQGEVLGEWITSNSNLNSHNVRLVLNPKDDIQLFLLYYHFSIDDKDAAGVSASSYAHEVDLIGSYDFNKYLSFTDVLGWSTPDDAAKETFGGADDDWLYSMLYAQVTF